MRSRPKKKKKEKRFSFSLREEERSFARVLFTIYSIHAFVCFLFSLTEEEEEEEEEWRSSTTRASIRFIT